MSNKKQSSIDWLEQEFVKLEATVGVHSVMYELIEQAKEMHKKETKKHFNNGYANGSDNWGDGSGKTAEQYYNETFGGNNERMV